MSAKILLNTGLIAGVTLVFQIASTPVQLAQQQGQQPGAAAVAGQEAPRGGGRVRPILESSNARCREFRQEFHGTHASCSAL
jgi:hypothetical protein